MTLTAIHRDLLIEACIGYVRRIDGPAAHAAEAQDLVDAGLIDEIETPEAQIVRTSDGVIRAWCLGITERGKDFLTIYGSHQSTEWQS